MWRRQVNRGGVVTGKMGFEKKEGSNRFRVGRGVRVCWWLLDCMSSIQWMIQINWFILLINLYFHALFIWWMVFYSIIAHNQYQMIWWDEPEPTSVLNVIHVCGWDSHTWDMDHKSYTWSFFITSEETRHLIWKGCGTAITMR